MLTRRYGVRDPWGGFIPRTTRGTRHTVAARLLRGSQGTDVGHQRPRMAPKRGRKHFRRWHAPYAVREMNEEANDGR